MNPIEEQREIIDKLYWLVRDSTPPKFTAVTCYFRFDHGYDDGSISIGSRISYETNGEIQHGLLRYPDVQMLDEAIPKLHALMKAHTGGDWNAFTLTIDKDGRVTTKFEYPDQDGKRPASPA